MSGVNIYITYVYIHIYMYVHVHTLTHINTHTHTHTHTDIYIVNIIAISSDEKKNDKKLSEYIGTERKTIQLDR